MFTQKITIVNDNNKQTINAHIQQVFGNIYNNIGIEYSDTFIIYIPYDTNIIINRATLIYLTDDDFNNDTPKTITDIAVYNYSVNMKHYKLSVV